MVVRQILVLFVLVRIQVGQQIAPRFARGFVFSGSEESFAFHSGRGNQNRTDEGGTGAIWVMDRGCGSAEADARRPELIQVGKLRGLLNENQQMVRIIPRCPYS